MFLFYYACSEFAMHFQPLNVIKNATMLKMLPMMPISGIQPITKAIRFKIIAVKILLAPCFAPAGSVAEFLRAKLKFLS